MALLWKKNFYTHGRESHRYVEDLIRNGKEICIVSPYIDAYYASFLRKNAFRKKIYILSSSLDPTAKKILQAEGFTLGVFVFAALVAIMDVLFLYARLMNIELLLASVGIVLLRIAIFRIFDKNMIRIRIPHNFVHAKIYVSGKMAVSGSANLTYRGMHSNIEHIEVTRDRSAVERLRKEFWELWDRSR